jgi:hypothetical protein
MPLGLASSCLTFKRVSGDVLRSRKFLGQKAQASQEVMLCNKFLSMHL